MHPGRMSVDAAARMLPSRLRAAAGTSPKVPEELLLGLAKGSYARANAAVGGLGSVVGKDPESSMYIVRLTPGDKLANVKPALMRRPGVRFVIPFAAKTVDTASLPSVEQHLAYIEAGDDLNGIKETTENADYYEHLRWFLEYRVNQQGIVDRLTYDIGASQRDLLPAAARPGFGPKPSGNWEFIGPVNLAIPYRRYFGNTPPLSGRVTAIAYNPKNLANIFISSGGGGIWETTDNGVTWKCITDSPSWKYSAVSSIAVDGKNPLIIYAGTGDYDGFFNFYSQGVMKTTDGGATWTSYGSEFGNQTVSHIIVDPTSDNILVASTGNGPGDQFGGYIWRSTNSGVTWTKCVTTGGTPLPNSSWSALVCGFADTGFAYYAAGPASNGIQFAISYNQGQTWNWVAGPVTQQDNHVAIATSGQGDQYFRFYYYLFCSDNQRMFVNDSISYEVPLTAPAHFPQASADAVISNWGQKDYDYCVGEAPLASNGDILQDLVYCGLITMAQCQVSEQQFSVGYSWQDIGVSLDPLSNIHADQHVILRNPSNSNEMLFGNDGGIYRFDYVPASNTYTYTSLNKNIGDTQFYAMAAHPTDPNQVMGGTQDNASPAAQGDLANWKNLQGGDGGHCAYDVPRGVFYTTGTKNSVYKYTSPTAFTEIDPGWPNVPMAPVAPLVVSNTGTVLMASFQLYRYSGAGKSWSAAGPLVNGVPDLTTTAHGYVRCLETCPTNNGILYTGANDGTIWMSSDLGATQAKWTRIDDDVLMPTGSNIPVGAISVNPQDPHDVLVGVGLTGTNTHLLRCPNTLATPRQWLFADHGGANNLPNVPVNAIQRDPYDPDNTWYVATDIGVFMTNTAGATWTNMTLPLKLPNTIVMDLKIGAGYLYAATYGRGIWRIPLIEPTHLTAFTLSAISIPGGSPVTGTVTVGNAPGGLGIYVGLTSGNAAAASLPAETLVAATASTSHFTVATVPVAADTSVVLHASLYGVVLTQTLVVKAPVLSGFGLSTGTIIGGFGLAGTVTLGSPAPSVGVPIAISYNASLMTAPHSVTVPAKTKTAMFIITTFAVVASTSTTVNTTLRGVTKTAPLMILISPLEKLTALPNPVVGGQTTVVTVTLSSYAPATGIVVKLASSNGIIAPVPASVAVPAGQYKVTFNIVTKKVGGTTPITITGKSEDITKTMTLIVNK